MKYGVIIETKNQAPILLEAEDMSFDATYSLYQRVLKRADVIGACLVRLAYENGHESLCPPEKEQVQEMPF